MASSSSRCRACSVALRVVSACASSAAPPGEPRRLMRHAGRLACTAGDTARCGISSFRSPPAPWMPVARCCGLACEMTGLPCLCAGSNNSWCGVAQAQQPRPGGLVHLLAQRLAGCKRYDEAADRLICYTLCWRDHRRSGCGKSGGRPRAPQHTALPMWRCLRNSNLSAAALCCSAGSDRLCCAPPILSRVRAVAAGHPWWLPAQAIAAAPRLRMTPC